MKQQKGFTLIELIVVIVILGILAATALPKFSGLTVDARVAKMQAVAGSISAASQMAHGQILAEQGASNASVILENGTHLSMAYYYPTADALGIWNAVDNTGLASAVNGGANTLDFLPNADRPSCYVRYTAANASASAVAPSNTVPAAVDYSHISATNCN